MNILVKFPSRSRPERFKQALSKYVELSEHPKAYIISIDEDDINVNTYEDIVPNYGMYYVYKGISESKIDACNRDMDKSGDWDIVVLASDDMIPQVKGWDTQIIEAYKTYFPDLDGVVHFDDGYQHGNCATQVIMGRKYYDRFGYLYHPDYKNLWCDVEFTEVAYMLGKYKYMGDGNVIIKHVHPFTVPGTPTDAQYQKESSAQAWAYDKKIFDERRARNYDLIDIVNPRKYGNL